MTTFTDVRQKRCGRCGGMYLPPGAGNGMCSDGCWVASRGRPQSQGDQLSRSWTSTQYKHEQRVVARSRVNALLSAAAAENEVKRYRQERREGLALISRMTGAGRVGASVSRSAGAEKHTGPGCRVCAEGRRRDAAAARSRDTGSAEIYR